MKRVHGAVLALLVTAASLTVSQGAASPGILHCSGRPLIEAAWSGEDTVWLQVIGSGTCTDDLGTSYELRFLKGFGGIVDAVDPINQKSPFPDLFGLGVTYEVRNLSTGKTRRFTHGWTGVRLNCQVGRMLVTKSIQLTGDIDFPFIGVGIGGIAAPYPLGTGNLKYCPKLPLPDVGSVWVASKATWHFAHF